METTMTTCKNNFFFYGGQRPPIMKPGAVAPGNPRLFLPVVAVVSIDRLVE
jgi:hypothetical protein